MKSISKVIFLIFLTSQFAYAQFSYDGPEAGSVSSGGAYNTGTKSLDEGTDPGFVMKIKPIKNIFSGMILSNPEPFNGIENSKDVNFITDPGIGKSNNTIQGAGDDFELIDSWSGFTMNGNIPPDPYLAVGPNHVVGVVNSTIRCWNKDGSLEFSKSASSWFSNVGGSNPFDPKIVYDHHNNRWVMAWLQGFTPSSSYILISASDDADPNGDWYNWSTPSRLNGSTSTNNWSDYPGLGFDQNNIYVASNQFDSGGSFQYAKVRVIGNTELYSGTPSSLSWDDVWNFRDINNSANASFTVRPSRAYSTSSTYYLITGALYNSNNSMTVIKMTGTANKAIALTAVEIPVSSYSHPNDMEQLGSGQSIDGGSAWFRNEPVYQNNKLYITHAVQNGNYSAVRYLEVNVSTNTASEDMRMGAEGFYYSYPAVAVDGSGNVVITYTRSADNEYAGAYFTTLPTVQSSLTGSKVVRAGNGSYYQSDGNRNRWGDYNGAWTDPSGTIFVNTEYVASTNSWGTYIGEITFSSPSVYVVVTAPNGGELFGVGDNTNITWQSSGIANVDIDFSTNNGQSWSSVATNVSASSGSYSWTVPSAASANCKIKVSSPSKSFLEDESNGVFTINSGGLDWFEVSSGTTGDIWGIDWVDANNVWACSDNGDVIKSTNGGNSWSDAGNAGEGAYSIAALSATTAVVSLGPSSGNGKIMRTTNSGSNWTQVYTASGAWFNFVDNISSTHLWAQSDPIGGDFHIVESIDAGATWSLASNPPAQPASDVFGANGSFYRIGNTAWFGTGGANGATQANKVYKTTNVPDGPWTSGTTTDQFVGSVAFSSESGNGLTTFWQSTDEVNKSANGGNSWTSQAASIGDSFGSDYVQGTNYAWVATSNGIFQTSNNGSNWSEDAIPPSVTGDMYVVRFYMDSDVGLAGGAGGVLLKSLLGSVVPVEFTSFTADTYDKSISLSWTTATETNNSGFQIERKPAGETEWENIAFVPGNGTTSEAQQYSFSDSFIDSYIRGEITYRLKQLDYDGTVSYSKEVNVNVDFTPESYTLQQNYPNPFNPTTTIIYELAEDGLVSLKVYDILGKEVAQLTNERQSAGKYELQFDAGSLSSGVYFYRLEVNDFSAMKKLVLLK